MHYDKYTKLTAQWQIQLDGNKQLEIQNLIYANINNSSQFGQQTSPAEVSAIRLGALLLHWQELQMFLLIGHYLKESNKRSVTCNRHRT